MEKVCGKLVEVLSDEKGYFGRVDTWGQRPTKYEYIGYELDTDFLPTLETMSGGQIKNLVKIINYFDIHAGSLKRIMVGDTKESLHDFYSEWAWSHFMTVVMFGMLEVAVIVTPQVVWKDKSKGYINKYKSIEFFLKTYLPQDLKEDLTKRYKTEEGRALSSFSEVITHLWEEIRSGFIHEAGVHCTRLEWSSLRGIGTREDPITIDTSVPMQEFMQITWLAILRSYGYQGLLELSKYKE